MDGKKGVAQKIVYGAFDIVKEKTGNEPAGESSKKRLENIMPVLEVKARRVGGSTYQVPMEVRPARRQTLGLRWLTTYSRNRSERTHERASCRRNYGRVQRHRRCVQKARGYPQDGRGQQGFRALQILICWRTF